MQSERVNVEQGRDWGGCVRMSVGEELLVNLTKERRCAILTGWGRTSLSPGNVHDVHPSRQRELADTRSSTPMRLGERMQRRVTPAAVELKEE
jgi:hypothetical protein